MNQPAEGVLMSGEARIDAAAPPARRGRGAAPLQMRFLAIWLAMIALVVIGGIVVPRSLVFSNMLPVLPNAAFLAIVAMGQTLVLMTRGIDLSVPAIITLSSTLLLGVSGGSDASLVPAIIVALAAATAIGVINGVLVGLLQLNALIVTLAVGAILTGVNIWYREGLPAEARVPQMLADFGSWRPLGINASIYTAVLLVIVLTIILRKTARGRRFLAVGANPRAAHVAGISLPTYQIAAFAVAGLLYGIAGVLISGFIRNPTLNVGDVYLLAPIAAAVLGGTAMSGGIGSMVAVAGAALFLTYLGQVLKMMGIATSFQWIVQGVAIALGMGLSQLRLPAWLRRRSG
ncbi:MAG: ABC transporter permease [Rhizobiaceae bacterium]